MRIFKIFVDMDKEEKYLNDMAKKGYLLEKYSSLGIYTFIKVEPKDLHYKIDYRMFKNESKFEQYKVLFEDTGWVHICGTKYSGGQFFLPSSNNLDSSDIFSDAESKAARYKIFVNECLLGFTITLMYFIVVLSSYGFKLSDVGYLTPGLWEKTGADFWTSFLFETPFAILRFLPFMFFTVATVVYGYWAYKAYKLYKKGLKDNGNIYL